MTKASENKASENKAAKARLRTRLSSASDVIDALGGTKAVAELLDVGASSVSNYRKLGFPARSHFILSKICTERGFDVADAVFGGYLVKPQPLPYRRTPGPATPALTRLEEAGFTRLSLPILQPAAPFIDRMGPEMQRRLYTFTDPGGEQLCLRPDLTIPTALAHIASGEDGETGAARYCYQGTAFRYQKRGSGQPEEFTQLGLEIIGGCDGKGDEQETIATIFEILDQAGLRLQDDNMRIAFTDFDMFTFFLDRMELDPEQRIRVRRTLELAKNPDDFAKMMQPSDQSAETGNGPNIGLDPRQIIAGRSGEDIQKRLEYKRQAHRGGLSGASVERIREFLTVCETAGGIDKFDNDFPEMKEWFDQRTDALAETIMPTVAGVLPLERIDFRPGINRSMAYYTGLSFEIYADGIDRPIATGGRYDDLLQSLGARQPLAAVGGAIAMERLAKAVELHS